tara:strand:+ start:262 stop:444 length:183 start_codon:yes stop_codon:yes gene_type:complete
MIGIEDEKNEGYKNKLDKHFNLVDINSCNVCIVLVWSLQINTVVILKENENEKVTNKIFG